MNIPSWDVLLLAVGGVFIAFAVIALHSRIIGSLLSAYAAYLIASVWGTPLFELLIGKRAIFGFSLSINVEEYVIKAGLFIALWLLFTTFVGFARKTRMPLYEVIIHAFFTVSFAISSVLTFMTDEQRAAIIDKSAVAKVLFNYHAILLVIPVIGLLFSAIRHDDDHRRN